MGLFQHEEPKKQTSADEVAESVARAFNNHFKEELRERGRQYFDKLLDNNETLFKKELDDAIEDVSVNLREYVVKKFNERLAEHASEVQAAQDLATKTLKNGTQDLVESQKEFSAAQDEALSRVDESVDAFIEKQQDFNDALEKGATAFAKKQEELGETLTKSIADQQETLVKAFEENMARIVENYLVAAIGEQYDLKSQLPSIIKQMEENKQAIVDDIKL